MCVKKNQQSMAGKAPLLGVLSNLDKLEGMV